MARYNSCTIVGRNGKDATLRDVGGTPLVSWSVAVDAYKRGDDPQWFECSWFGARAEKVHEYISKGEQIMVTGEVSMRSWDGRDGSNHSLAIRVLDVVFLGSRRDDPPPRDAHRDNHRGRSDARQERRETDSHFATTPRKGPGPKPSYDDDDEIPF